MCTPLAIATDSLILLVSFASVLPQDACASVDVLTLFAHLNCIALLDWLVWLHLPYCLQWVLVITILSTSLSACVVIELYWLVFLPCIIALYCVFAYTPSVYSEYRFISLLLIHMSACDCISLAGRTIYLYCYCVLLLVYCHWHWHLLLILCLLPQLLRAVAPAPTLITTFYVEASLVFCLLSLIDCMMIVM